MEPAQKVVAPLSPFMWTAPQRRIITPGSVPGKVGDVRDYITDLNVNFDLIVKEFAHPYEHPVYEIFQKHPVHTSALNRRQFDVLRYGMVLDVDQRLVIMEAPRACADAGTRVAREYKAIFNTRLDHTEISKHPLLPEYSLVVMRLPKDGEAEVPELLFRMVFRNEAYNETNMPLAEMSTNFPLFRLRSVYVPSKSYEKMDEIYRYRMSHPGVFTTEAGKRLPNPKVEQILLSTPIRELCDAWVLVVDGIAPQWVREKGLGPDVVNLFLKTHRPTSSGGAQQDGLYCTQQEGQRGEHVPLLDNRVRLNYTQNAQRMQQRVRVMKREAGLITRWRDGDFDLPVFETETLNDKKVVTPLADPQVGKTPCARMLMRLTRGGQNNLEDGEICAFVPEEHEYAEQHVYRTRSAEKLRLWVLKGLMTAELNNVHAVLLDMDPMMLLAQCVGLLHGEDDDGTPGGSVETASVERKRESIFHVCKIVVETVEDYVQHSGVVWQVTLAVNEEGVAAKAVALCEEMLQLTQRAKARVEEQERERFYNKDRSDASNGELGHSLHCGGSASKDNNADGTSSKYYRDLVARAGTGALVVRDEKQGAFFHPSSSNAGIAKHVADRASAIGYEVRDTSLYPLFESLCSDDGDTVPVKNLVRILLDKLEGGHQCAGRHSSLYWPMENPLLNLDSCGIPCNERSVTNFVMGFCLKPYRSLHGKTTVAEEEEPTLNYVEFSMMMLALAHQ